MSSCDDFDLFRLFPLVPQVVLLYVDMLGTQGVEGIPLPLSRFPDCLTIMFTAIQDKNVMIKCMEAGASAYLKKNAVKNELMHAIMMVLRGKFYVISDMAPLMIEYLKHGRNFFCPLSQLEKKTMYAILEGLGFAELLDKKSDCNMKYRDEVSEFAKKLNNL